MKIQVTGNFGCHFGGIGIALAPGASICVSAVGHDSMKFGRWVGQKILAIANGSCLDVVGREDSCHRTRLFRVDNAQVVLAVVLAFHVTVYARAEEAPRLGQALSVFKKFHVRPAPSSYPWQTFID